MHDATQMPATPNRLDALLKPLPTAELAEYPTFARLALEEDRATVLDMAEAYFNEAADAFPTLAFDRSVADATFSACLGSAHPTIFVVERKRELLGFVSASIQGLQFSKGIFAHCEALYVRPEHRGSRAAAILLDAFDRWSDTIGARFSLGGNQNGLSSERTARLYEKFGFQRVGFHMMKARRS